MSKNAASKIAADFEWNQLSSINIPNCIMERKNSLVLRAPNDNAEKGDGRKRARPKNEIAECFFPTRQKKDKAEKRLRRIFKIGS